MQHEREPLVRRHPSGEPDREHIGVEHVVDPAEFGLTRTPLEPGRVQASASFVDEPAAQRAAYLPQLVIVEPVGAAPGGAVGAKVDAEVGLDQALHLTRDPRRRVHAVGDRA